MMDGICKIDKLASRVKELNYKACMITDHGNVSGCVKFHGEMKKKGIKPILGSELYISKLPTNIKNDENRKNDHLVIIAKNKEGWQQLMKIVSSSNHPDNFYYKPRLDIQKLAEKAEKKFIIFTGHSGSILHNYAMDMEASKKCLANLKELFGEENVIIELQLFKLSSVDEQERNLEYVNFLRQLAKETNTKAVACQDIHYINQKDAILQRIMLCSNVQKTLKQVENMPEKPMAGFFDNDCFYLPSIEEMRELGYTDEELDMSFIFDQCEMYDIQNQPLLPKFCDNEPEFIKELCREGWKKKARSDWNKELYGNRVKQELEVFNKWNLNGYFLIVQDYINWAKKEGMFVGPGRGSSGGSLVAYLTNITEIDPIQYDLSFERFFNESRCSPGNISLPDIDTDFPSDGRESVIEYIKFKYGPENVAKIATFGALKGKAAIKEVLRIYEVCDFEMMNEITKNMPNEAEIADELEEQDEDSIINWCLVNNPKIFQDYCKLEDGKLVGEYAQYFKIAIDLEGVYKSHGIHAAGLIVTDRPITELSPVFYDSKTGEAIVALDKKDAEKIGLVKYDILGLSILSKLQMVKHILKYGKLK
jgi:DNA polymerase-3 subunit alpha